MIDHRTLNGCLHRGKTSGIPTWPVLSFDQSWCGGNVRHLLGRATETIPLFVSERHRTKEGHPGKSGARFTQWQQRTAEVDVSRKKMLHLW